MEMKRIRRRSWLTKVWTRTLNWLGSDVIAWHVETMHDMVDNLNALEAELATANAELRMQKAAKIELRAAFSNRTAEYASALIELNMDIQKMLDLETKAPNATVRKILAIARHSRWRMENPATLVSRSREFLEQLESPAEPAPAKREG